MKIIAENKEEFDELKRTFLYLHDVTHWKRLGFNWRFWQWYWMKSIFNYEGVCLDLEKYPLLNSMVHLYRVDHAHLEGKNGKLESIELNKMFYIKENK